MTKVFMCSYAGGDKQTLGVFNAVNAKLLKEFDWCSSGYLKAQEWCKEKKYEVETDHCKGAFGEKSANDETLPLKFILTAYKDYAKVQISGGEADIGMLDTFFKDYLHVDPDETYAEALEEMKSVEFCDEE